MHQLTIDHTNATVTATDHGNFDDAHRALLKYVVRADYYLRPVQNTVAHTSYQLLHLIDADNSTPQRDPFITTTATITKLPDTGTPIASPYFAACDTQRWIGDHAAIWLHGSASDPGYHYPMAVLTMAHGDGHHLLHPGTLLPEAAHLASIDDLTSPAQKVIPALRHKAIHGDTHADQPSTIADAVQQLLSADTSDPQTALIWYYPLLRWGAHAP